MSAKPLAGREVNQVSSPAPSWTVQLLYDGSCALCVQEIAFWQERYRMSSPLRRIFAEFVDVSHPTYQPQNYGALTIAQLAGTIVGRLPNGEMLQNPALFDYLQDLWGVGLLFQATRWPGVGKWLQPWYQNWAKEKLPLTAQSGQFSPIAVTPIPVMPQTIVECGDQLSLELKEDESPAASETLPIDPAFEVNFQSDLELPELGAELGFELDEPLTASETVPIDPTFEVNFKDDLELLELGAELGFELDEPLTASETVPIDPAFEVNFKDDFDLPHWLELDTNPQSEPLFDLQDVEILGLADLEMGLEVGSDFLNTLSNAWEKPVEVVDLDDRWFPDFQPDDAMDLEMALLELEYFGISIAGDEVRNDLISDPSPSFDLETDQLADVDNWDALEQLLEVPLNLPESASHPTFPEIPLLSPPEVDRSDSPIDFMDTFIETPPSVEEREKSSILPIGEFMHMRQSRSKQRSGRVDQNMKVSVRQLDTLGDLIAEMVVSRNCMEAEHERARQFLTNLLYQMQQLSDVGQRLRDLYERSLLESALLSSRQAFNVSNRSSKGGNSIAQKELDALEMDHFSEFHLLSQEMIELIVRARESASDIDYVINEPLDYIARHFRQVTTQVQEGLTRTRMVPFEQGTTRLPRAIREVSSRSGKQARLVVEGRETLIDKVLLEQLYDPLTHLINNAVSHGIELPVDREQRGKDPCGLITIRTFYQGNQTVIVVEDDGAGIDADRIREKALGNGLISLPEAQTWTNIQLYDLIFHPGFSTRDQADDFSGRGVGMDVVKTRIEQLRGTISVDSNRDKGTKFTIRLPLTLSITKALCCISNRARIAFPIDSVEDMMDFQSDQVTWVKGKETLIQWHDRPIPFKELSDLFHYNHQTIRSTVYGGGNPEEETLSIVILRSGTDRLAIVVDWVEGEKEIVIKQLEGPVPKPPGIAGVTVLSDGQILPVADVLELMEMAQGKFRQSLSSLWYQQDNPPSVPVLAHQPIVLIVDDSITVRELLSLTFSKSNYRVEQARDGREAWDKLRSGLPCDLIFCDIEMPRMTGLELLEKLQHDPKLGKIPIAMLTSRGADRHRQIAIQLGATAYFTKPYLEEVLLDAAHRMLAGEILIKLN